MESRDILEAALREFGQDLDPVGCLRATRPGNGLLPGRTYRVRRKDLAEFVAASQSRPASS